MSPFQRLRDVFRAPSADQLAVHDLEEAQRKLLDAQAQQEYVTAMATMYLERVARLQARIKGAPL